MSAETLRRMCQAAPAGDACDRRGAPARADHYDDARGLRVTRAAAGGRDAGPDASGKP